ncbi:MAG: hypothetical protein D0433_09470 [Candidatus Thermochlorobacter aerophilum]|uniref:Uncharacterized protein n=1 Tax=Candidatus Thermochlorobacter aerophilus TaxID=1868324 RepID=A0A395LZ13_9BACT|nr:MAG: hypothetical protein D0433_09470 [Candidatus Thermochlorobacter aerophilum]
MKTKLCSLVLALVFCHYISGTDVFALFRHLELTFVVMPSTLFLSLRAQFCHAERSKESSAWMLHFVQHDQGNVMPHTFGHGMHAFPLSYRA